MKGHHYTTKDIEFIRTCTINGWTLREIAENLGRSRSSIYLAKKKYLGELIDSSRYRNRKQGGGNGN